MKYVVTEPTILWLCKKPPNIWQMMWCIFTGKYQVLNPSPEPLSRKDISKLMADAMMNRLLRKNK